MCLFYKTNFHRHFRLQKIFSLPFQKKKRKKLPLSVLLYTGILKRCIRDEDCIVEHITHDALLPVHIIPPFYDQNKTLEICLTLLGGERDQNAGGEPSRSISLDLFIRLHYFPPTSSSWLPPPPFLQVF